MFHGACVELTDNDLDVFQGTGKVWSCKKCTSALSLQRANSDSTPVKANTISATSSSAPVTIEQLNILLTKMKDELLDKLGAEISACRKTLEENAKEIAKQGASITALKEENSHLKTKLRELELKQDDQEQYGRRNTLEVFGVPEMNNEDVQGRILEIGKALNVKLDRTSIDACHRLPRRKDNIAPGIIVRFVRRGDKDALLKNRKQCRDFSTQHIKLQGNSPIYINQSLTADRRRLFGQVKKVQRERGFRHVWIDRVGRIKVRWEDGGPIHIVRCDEDLHNLKNEKKDDADVSKIKV
ncbi:uncharacterized protein LOC120351980 [Nilaparvata lugens]|uniref:uncharacterized protein LOC120351980 n=1 Tax=Nilaparvata lugens TaxID=108931 RepID=UPI00193CF4CF|nr:uncharacterized protein LOC120351980 [Nilaparvata lugens]